MHPQDKTTKETKAEIPILIVAKSDRMRNNLKILLEIKPQIKVVAQTDEVASVLKMVNQYRPTLIMVDTNLPANGVWLTILKQIKAEAPRTRCLILGDTTQRLQIARVAGADAVLRKGFTQAKLFATIKELFKTWQVFETCQTLRLRVLDFIGEAGKTALHYKALCFSV